MTRTNPSCLADIADVDVAIVGYGPVGATLANMLGQGGISTLVLERESAAYHLPRAAAFDDEVMRVFQAIGLAEQIAARTHVSPGMRFIDAEGRLILDWSRPSHVGPQGWHASDRFHQPELEDVLRAGTLRWPNVTVRPRCEVFALDAAEDGDGVAIRFEELSAGRLRRCRARYVVGCDGARSLVRRFIGSPLQDLGFHERWLVVDVILKRPRPDLGDYSVQYCDPARPATYVRGTGDRRRWEIAMLPGEDAQAMTSPARVWELLERWITPADAELERAASYTFHSAIAERWREGPLLIAGDSAHQTPPFLGQGMCAGIRDAANLAWKLVRVLRGQASDDLLDSYQAERGPHVREYIDLAVRLGGLINTKAIGAALPASALNGGGPARMELIRPPLGPGLGAGWTGPTGRLAPQPLLADGARLDDRVGDRFALLLNPSFAAALPSGLLGLLAAGDVAVVADDVPGLQDWLQAVQAEAVLVRPDRYVLGAARTPQELEALAAMVCPLPGMQRSHGRSRIHDQRITEGNTP